MSTCKKPTDYFDGALARMLATKIGEVHLQFPGSAFVNAIESGLENKALKQRVEFMADELFRILPQDYPRTADILMQILGPENPSESGMVTEFYWLMPVAKFVEKYGLDHYEVSIRAIGEITKCNTGEYAIRPYIRAYPDKTLAVMRGWATSPNFRRLASEGLRPQLPWATKLELFIEDPTPVFGILNLLKEDPVHFVKKSVANHITDYLKVNQVAAEDLIASCQHTVNKHTRWIVN